MARALLRQGVTSFLPTAPSLPEPEIPRFAARVREWMPSAPADGAEPLGFNLEGPFIAPARKGAHDPALLRTPGEHRPGRPGRLARRAADHDDRPRAAGGLALIAAAGRPRDRPVHRPLRGDAGGGAGRLSRAGPAPEDDDAPVQRDDRRRPPPPGSRGRGAHGRRRVRRADRGRLPRPPRAVADHPALQAGRPAHPRQRRAVARRDGRWAGARSGAWTWRSTAAARRCRDGHAGRARSSRSTWRSATWSARGCRSRSRSRRPSSNPAALLGATDRGRIEVGRRAHLVELDDDLRVPEGHARGGLVRRVRDRHDGGPDAPDRAAARSRLPADVAGAGRPPRRHPGRWRRGSASPWPSSSRAGSAWHREAWVHPPGHPRRGRLVSRRGAAVQVPAVVARRRAAVRRRARAAGRVPRAALRGRAHRASSTPRSWARSCSASRSRSSASRRPTFPPAREAARRAGPPPRRLPDRLRPRRERPQGGRGDRRRGRVQRGDRLGPGATRRTRSGTIDQIMDSLRRAAAHLPRVDAIGGSSAGVYVDNEVRVGVAVPGRPAGRLRGAGPGDCSTSCRRPGAASRSRS